MTVCDPVPMDNDEYSDTSFWSRPFRFGDFSVRVEELWGEGIGGTVWEGGILLSHFLRSDAAHKSSSGNVSRAYAQVKKLRRCSSSAFNKREHMGGRCIELGSGVSALPSLVATHLRCFSQVGRGIFCATSACSSHQNGCALCRW